MKTLNQIMQEKFSPEQRDEVRRKAQEKVATLRLQQVRKSHNVTQKELAASTIQFMDKTTAAKKRKWIFSTHRAQ